MEASAYHAPTRLARLTSAPTLLRLRSDEQLVSMLRAGSHDAFRAIYERYGQRLFAYVRQMLGPGSRQDAEDVLQDVFARTYTALQSEDREINLRPWLYRVAHNRCIDHLRRPAPLTVELLDTPAKALHDPFEEVQRREDLQRLVSDIARLPDQQKSALLLRELNGLSYRDLAEALEVTVPAVKSLLVRARLELVETAEARETACVSVREELALGIDDRARTSPRTRRHLRDCAGCRQYQSGIRGMRRSFAALSPFAAVGPLAAIANAAGIGGSGGGAGATGAGGGVAGGLASGGLVSGTAAKVVVVASTAAIGVGGAVEIDRRVGERTKAAPAAATQTPAASGREIGGAALEPLRSTGEPTRTATSGPRSTHRDGDRTNGGRTRRAGGGSDRGGSERARQEPRGGVGGPAADGAPVGASPPAVRRDGGVEVGGGSPGADIPSEVRPQTPAGAPDRPAIRPIAPRPSAPTVPGQRPPTPVPPLPGVEMPVPPVPGVEMPAMPPVIDQVRERIRPGREVVPLPGVGIGP